MLSKIQPLLLTWVLTTESLKILPDLNCESYLEICYLELSQKFLLNLATYAR